MKINFLPLLIIVILALALRLILLDKIPIGISDDELDYALNAKAVFLTGKDISGTWSPFSLTPPPFEYPKAELPYVIIAPLIGPFDLSLLSARLPYAIFSVLLIILLYLTAYKLFGANPAFIVGLVGAINPWSIYFGRTAFDAPLSIFFYLLALYGLLFLKSWRIFLIFPFLFIGFYTYIGAKVTLIPFTFLISFFVWRYINKKLFRKQYILLCLLSIILVIFFIFSSASKSLSRTSELVSFNSSTVIQRVDKERQLSVAMPFNNIFLNKITIFTKDSIEKFLGFYSSQFLFLYGDARSTFSVWNHGMFYYFDVIFLLIGFYAIYQKYKSFFWLITGMLIVGPLPSILNATGITYPTRASLVFPFLILIIGIGIWYFLNTQLVKKYKKKAAAVILCIYLILLANFMHIYLARNPIYNSEGFGFSGRVFSKYVDLAGKAGLNVVFIEKVSPDSIPPLFKQYLFYTNSYNSVTARELRTLIREGNFAYKNLSMKNCPEKPISPQTVIITVPDIKCETIDKETKHNNIAQLSDGGTIYSVFNDNLCTKYNLSRYPIGITLRDFDVENLSEERFCTQFITQFR